MTVSVPPGTSSIRHHAGRSDSSLAQLYRRLFSDTPERSVRVRVVALLASLWAVMTLVLTGASVVVPLAVAPFFIIGHVVAYRAMDRRIPALPIIIALVIIVVGVAMRHELVLAVRGERIPVAHFLLIAGAASVFEARTRAGLYTQLFFSALIMFFASELAFGNEFAGLLGGYLALIVVFLALSQYTDITREASVSRRGGIGGASLLWSGAAVFVGVASFASFLLLPWDASQTPEAARFAILPHTGTGDGTEPPVTPEQARELMERSAQSLSGGGGQLDLSGLDLSDLSGLEQLLSDASMFQGDTGEFPPDQQGSDGGGRDGTPLEAPEFEEGTVAFIRSAVASYWRGNVYDSFRPAEEGSGEEGGDWLATLPDGRRLGSLFARQRGRAEDDRYLQTFFLRQGLGPGFITGYEPLSISIPRDAFGLPTAPEGTTYQVVSGRPAIDPVELRHDRGGWVAAEFSRLPAGYGEVYSLARVLSAAGETDFDRAAIIAAYLRNLEYDPESTNALESSAGLREFVFGESPGSAIDFATAQALMARAAGLQSRVATGFLPGSFNPYSGAAEIRDTDVHAWAEVYFEEAGWVPFDASSRPDLPSASSLESPPPSGFSSLLQNRLGDNLASALNSSPGGLAVLFRWLLKAGPFLGVSVMLITAIAGFAFWWYRLRRRSAAGRELELMGYSALSDPGWKSRLRLLEEFRRLEKRIAKAGFRRRRFNEPIGAYARSAAAYMEQGGEGVLAAAQAVEAAIYSSAFVDPAVAGSIGAEMRSLRLRSALAGR